MSPLPVSPLPAADDDDATDAAFVAAATAEREAVAAGAESHVWNGLPLTPWDAGSASLLARLVSLDLPADSLDDVPRLEAYFAELAAKEQAANLVFEEAVDLTTYLPTAAKLLFIAATPRAQWFPLRSRPLQLIEKIEAWTLENIPPEEVRAACSLAARIAGEYRKVQAIRRPSGHAPGGLAGN